MIIFIFISKLLIVSGSNGSMPIITALRHILIKKDITYIDK